MLRLLSSRVLCGGLLLLLLAPRRGPAGLLGQGGGGLAGAALRGAAGRSATGSPWYRTRAKGFDPARDALAFGNGDFDVGRCHGLVLVMVHAFRTLSFRKGSAGAAPVDWARAVAAGRGLGRLALVEGLAGRRVPRGARKLLPYLLTASLPRRVEVVGPHDGLVSFSASPAGRRLLESLVKGVPTGLGQATNFGIKGRAWDSNRASCRTVRREIERTGLPQVVSFVDLKPASVDTRRLLDPWNVLIPVRGLVEGVRSVRRNPGFGEGHTVLVYEAAPFDDRWELLAVDPQLSVQPGETPRVLRIRVWDADDRVGFHWIPAGGGAEEDASGTYGNLRSMFPFDADSPARRRGLREWFLRE